MGRLNLMLLLALALAAVLLVTSAHKARRLNMAVVEAERQAMLLDAEYARLQTEIGTLGVAERVAGIARNTLKMREPDRRIVDVGGASGPAISATPALSSKAPR